ncbi:tektin-3-like [Paramacrobiotus metropolitanus]|uniref:tektin-3-like n=1 Tax=Paramacrobiotus metropolitanus TaxID=2943436 RepID=UPI00244581A4|nr:tektin-3-like [Paramacrobiotus metropolitanus]
MDVREFQRIWAFQENRTHHALGEKCKESTVLKNQIKSEIDFWRDILRNLQLLHNRTRNALYWTQLPLEINHEIVSLLVKAVQDIPDFLMAAIKDEANAIIQRSEEMLKMQGDVRQKEIEANHIRSQLEGFWNDKTLALDVDVIAHNVSVDSRFITYKPLAEGANLAVSHNKEGESFYRTTDTIKRSQILRDLQHKFLKDCDRGIAFTATAIQNARDKVISALAEGHHLAHRMKELNQEQLLSANEEKERFKKDYLDLRNAVHDNNRSLMLAETRLFTRTQKPSTEQEDDESNKALLDQLQTMQKVYRDNVLPMKSLQRGVQDLLDSEIDISRSIELVNNKLITVYGQCAERGRFYPTSQQLLGLGSSY